MIIFCQKALYVCMIKLYKTWFVLFRLRTVLIGATLIETSSRDFLIGAPFMSRWRHQMAKGNTFKQFCDRKYKIERKCVDYDVR